MSLTLGPADYYKPGDYNALCDVCGFKFKASQLRRRWDGYQVCATDYEERHPQDLLRSKPEKQAVPWSRPEPVDVFIEPYTIQYGDGQPVALPGEDQGQ